jgi:hypothetical protein
MKLRAPELSAEDLDQVLEADEHFAAALLAEPFSDEGDLEAACRIANDIAIEGHYRPESVAQIRALRPSLHRAGLGFPLDRWRTQMIGTRTVSGKVRGLFTRQVEAWINFLWDEPDLDPLLDSAVHSTEDLVAWLRREAGTYRGLESVFTGQGGKDEEEDAE